MGECGLFDGVLYALLDLNVGLVKMMINGFLMRCLCFVGFPAQG